MKSKRCDISSNQRINLDEKEAGLYLIVVSSLNSKQIKKYLYLIMNSNDNPKIKKYLALAGSITSAVSAVNAQVVYTDINPDFLLTGNFIPTT